MDSKKALEYFLEFSRFNNTCVLSCDECPNKLCNIKRAYEEIKNDLNMLEGLKKDYLELSHEWQKDLQMLGYFRKLFEGEDLNGWIEFDFHEPNEDYINKIRKWLKNDK